MVHVLLHVSPSNNDGVIQILSFSEKEIFNRVQ